MARYRQGIWPLRYPRTSGYVRMKDKGTLILAFPVPNDPGFVVEFEVDRADARLWARRINECLEASK